MQELFKRYIDVELRVSKDGTAVPTAIYWGEAPHQKRFSIDRVIRGPEYSVSSLGGAGKKYTVLICGEKRVLYREKCIDKEGHGSRRWFIESMKP